MTNDTPELNFHQIRCIECALATEDIQPDFRCEKCGDALEVAYPTFFADKLSKKQNEELRQTWRSRKASSDFLDRSGVWRFRELLPRLEPDSVVSLAEGNTPLYDLPRCARLTGLNLLLAKHQGMNPTGSFKDTGMTVAASVAKAKGYRWVACASTGNTSASMAAYASRGGTRGLVLIPEGKISWSKLSQSLDYGAITCQLRMDFDGCVRVLNELVRRAPVYMLNSVNPFRPEGQKTAAFEILEQMGWQPPDHLIVPGGNLANSSALGKAFIELHALGLISRMPKISVVQAEGANPLVRSWRENGGNELTGVVAETRATAIRIGHPASWKKAVRVIRTTGGTVEQVTESEIALAKSEIGAEGIGCEPASAVTLAGLKKLRAAGFVQRDESVVLLLTGHVLKDPEFTLDFHRGDFAPEDASLAAGRRSPLLLEGNVDAVLRVLEKADAEN